MPVLFQGWFTSSKEVYVIGNLFSIWLNLHRILQNEDFCLCLVQPVQAVSNEKVAESVMLIDAFLPTDYYSYGKSYIYLGWFLFKHCTFKKGLWEASWDQKDKEGGGEGGADLPLETFLQKRYEEMSRYFFWRDMWESSKEWSLILHLKKQKLKL